MGNSCCTESNTNPNLEVSGTLRKVKYEVIPEQTRGIQEHPVTFQDVENFNRGPTDFFTLNDKIINLIAKHPVSNLKQHDKTVPFKKVTVRGVSSRDYQFFGQMQNGQREGVGMIYFLDKGTSGTPVNEHYHPMQIPAGGEFVAAKFKNDMLDGPVLVYTPDGSYFEGTYSLGQPAKGKILFSNGDLYEGPFKEGKFHGRGQLTFADGRKYVGEFSKGSLEGFGRLTFPTKSWYEGNWKGSILYGKCSRRNNHGLIEDLDLKIQEALTT